MYGSASPAAASSRSWALRTIPVGTGYAVWTGIGAVGAAILGMVLFNESRDALRIACIGLIVLGILGLKFATPAGPAADLPAESSAGQS